MPITKKKTAAVSTEPPAIINPDTLEDDATEHEAIAQLRERTANRAKRDTKRRRGIFATVEAVTIDGPAVTLEDVAIPIPTSGPWADAKRAEAARIEMSAINTKALRRSKALEHELCIKVSEAIIAGKDPSKLLKERWETTQLVAELHSNRTALDIARGPISGKLNAAKNDPAHLEYLTLTARSRHTFKQIERQAAATWPLHDRSTKDHETAIRWIQKQRVALVQSIAAGTFTLDNS